MTNTLSLTKSYYTMIENTVIFSSPFYSFFNKCSNIFVTHEESAMDLWLVKLFGSFSIFRIRIILKRSHSSRILVPPNTIPLKKDINDSFTSSGRNLIIKYEMPSNPGAESSTISKILLSSLVENRVVKVSRAFNGLYQNIGRKSVKTTYRDNIIYIRFNKRIFFLIQVIT